MPLFIWFFACALALAGFLVRQIHPVSKEEWVSLHWAGVPSIKEAWQSAHFRAATWAFFGAGLLDLASILLGLCVVFGFEGHTVLGSSIILIDCVLFYVGQPPDVSWEEAEK